MADGWKLKTLEITITQELWDQVELFAGRTNTHIANVPGRLIRAGIEAEYARFPKLRDKSDG